MTRRTHAACLAAILLDAVALTCAQHLPVDAAALVAVLSVAVFELLAALGRKVR
ncbi:hypothetical protein GCM10022286_00270 [Gryllotalpicola daejeonensis]|uniref:Uncharacterized protein n=1 Tax=Gryllotalpicola daejeonensis TaxID=993087 RepID=A0ABP7ZCP5_9MICO